MIVLDTNVLSELMRSEPAAVVFAWISAQPRATGETKAFVHDGGEIIWSLPNGLQAYLLTKASGGLLARGPAAIVEDSEGRFVARVVGHQREIRQ